MVLELIVWESLGSLNIDGGKYRGTRTSLLLVSGHLKLSFWQAFFTKSFEQSPTSPFSHSVLGLWLRSMAAHLEELPW